MKRRKIPLREARMCDPRGLLSGKRSAWPLTRRVAPSSPRQERGEVKKAATAALAILAAALMLNASALRADAQTPAPVELRILAINDFHGNLLPPTGGIRIADPDDKTKKIVVPAGGARFHYLAASTVEKSTGKTVFPPYEIKQFDGIPVAFIGLTLKGTPDIVSPVGVAGLEFKDEADTVNALVPELKAQGVEAIVVLIHEGGFPAGDYNECPGISGPIVDIVRKLDHAVDVVISGHTHQAYVCDIDGRLVTSGDKFGTIVTSIDLKLDPATRDVVSAKADNIIVRTGVYAKDPEQTALLASYDKFAAPIANRVAGSVTDTLSRTPNDAGESPLGDIVADAQLAATSAETNGGAVIAITNPGGIRTDIPKKDEGAVSYADVFASQPFRNQLVTLTLTGMQIKNMLEQQWLDPKRPRILQVSKGFSYAWDGARPYGERVAADRMSLNGQRIGSATSYRVTVNNFLSVGGDGFTVLREGIAPRFGVYDVDALFAFFRANSPIGPAPADRIVRMN
jgi:5'-nucleotidase